MPMFMPMPMPNAQPSTPLTIPISKPMHWGGGGGGAFKWGPGPQHAPPHPQNLRPQGAATFSLTVMRLLASVFAFVESKMLRI